MAVATETNYSEDLTRFKEEDESKVLLLDPSELYRPEHKTQDRFREFNTEKVRIINLMNNRIGILIVIFNLQNDPIQQRVKETYTQMHENQTMAFVKDRMNYWCSFDKVEMDIMSALEKLNLIVDESDPDVDIPNIFHAFQTAESIRRSHPTLDWFHLTGLIHDLGKLMAFYGEPQWAVVGDTFPVGCLPVDTIPYRETSFNNNPDLANPSFNTKYGIYSPNCGLDKVTMSWGHDEYMYRVLKNHKSCTLPEEGLYMIRYHSFYPWHTDHHYNHLCSKADLDMLKWVNEFNKFDLYSKTPELPDIDALMPYYQALIDKYIPGLIKW